MTTARRKSNPVALGVEAARPDTNDNSPGESHRPPPNDVAPQRIPAPHNNLSLPRSPLIGRDHEVAIIQQLLLQEQVGLLTLTGPGGIGKTRLALQVAANLLDHFVDGVYFVSLAPISDPDLVASAIAQTVGVSEAAGRSMQESLQAYLRDRQLLLVLDNFEQVAVAARLVGDLLNTCRRLKTLVTSRAALHLYGEQEFPVPPLALPNLTQLAQSTPTATVTQYAAIDLFCQRASAAKPDFALTASNVTDVAKICLRLDGLPLAIELAAARIKLFSPSALLAHLNQRLPLLTGGPHDQPARQRTLRDDIAWSYDLLAADEQALFRRLAIFIGGFTLEAAQAVGNPSTARLSSPKSGSGQVLGIDVLDGIATLVDQNLLKQLEQSGGEARFGMLETIREYGREQLAVSGEAEAICRQHATFFLTLAEATAPALGGEQANGLARLAVEHANLRTALMWSQEETNGTETGLRLTNALTDFWMLNGYWSEGRHWFEAALARTTVADRTEARANALVSAGELAVMQGDERTAQIRLAEGLAIAKERGAQPTIAIVLTNLGWIAQAQHDHALAYAKLTESLDIRRELGDKYGIGSALVHLGVALYDDYDYAGAQSLYEEGLALFQELEAEWEIADVFHYMGQVAQREGESTRAWALFRESLTRWRELGTLQWKGIAACLEGLAGICADQRQFAQAARLFGSAEAAREFLSSAPPLLPGDSANNKYAALHVQLDAAAFAVAWAEGRRFTPEQAVDYALALPDVSPAVPVLPPPPAYPAGLTAREVEVLRLLAQGLTYAQIAEKLIVTRRTVNGHVTSIYSKLGVNGRAAATRFAAAQRLV